MTRAPSQSPSPGWTTDTSASSASQAGARGPTTATSASSPSTPVEHPRLPRARRRPRTQPCSPTPAPRRGTFWNAAVPRRGAFWNAPATRAGSGSVFPVLFRFRRGENAGHLHGGDVDEDTPAVRCEAQVACGHPVEGGPVSDGRRVGAERDGGSVGHLEDVLAASADETRPLDD